MNYELGIKKKEKIKKTGFTLIEVIIGVTIFLMVAGSIYQAFSLLVKTARLSRLKVTATLIANEQLEIARNLPYAQIGIPGGIPSGEILQQQTIEKNGASFQVITTVRNVDDPFDGVLGGNPNDIAPADYKKVEIDVSCPGCGGLMPIKLVTDISSRDLEVSSDNGALFINVFDALGQPVSGANINVINSLVVPAINLSDVSGNSGSLQLIDVPPSNQQYQISVDRSGYSEDMTYLPGLPDNPNPVKPHATVATKQVTQISFSIDKLSALNVSTVTANCTTTSNVDFSLEGSKIIGTNPDVYKYNANHTTDVDGQKNISGIEWDTYRAYIPVTLTGSYFLAGTLPMLPLSLLPDTSQSLLLVTKQKNPNALLASVKDIGSKLPITGATVSLSNGQSLTTGRGYLSQVDWSGGSGQQDLFDQSRYLDSSQISVNNPVGEVKLASALDQYESSGYLESSTFDTGSISNFYNLIWGPIDQPPATGVDSVRFQIATNNDNTTWNYLGPDGTNNSYYTSSGDNIGSIHNGDRYLRYKIYLSTIVETSTPNISDVSFTFTSACVPSGQVFFDGLPQGTYQMDVTKSGYHAVSDEGVSVVDPWQEKIIYMTPE